MTSWFRVDTQPLSRTRPGRVCTLNLCLPILKKKVTNSIYFVTTKIKCIDSCNMLRTVLGPCQIFAATTTIIIITVFIVIAVLISPDNLDYDF